MNEIIDKLLLLICCLALYLLQMGMSYAVVPLILCVALSSLFMYVENDRIRLIGVISFTILCFFLPAYMMLLPVLLYDLFHTRYQYAAIVVPALLLAHQQQYELIVIVFSILFLVISFLLKRKTDKLKHLHEEYNDLRDSSASYSQLMEEKNRSILKNQDYEINLATLNERNRISKEIHDNIGHMLSRALLQVGALLTICQEEPLKEGLTALKTSLSSGMDDIRNSIHKMYDESIDLYAQVEQLCKDFTFCPIAYEYDIKHSPPLVLKHSLLAIIKEALANIMRHSNATKASILLREHPAMYQLIILDNGTMDERKKSALMKLLQSQEQEEGMGLRNITDRVKGFDGNINISLENGFKLFITIPKK